LLVLLTTKTTMRDETNKLCVVNDERLRKLWLLFGCCLVVVAVVWLETKGKTKGKRDSVMPIRSLLVVFRSPSI
jgi:hypothetical protein